VTTKGSSPSKMKMAVVGKEGWDDQVRIIRIKGYGDGSYWIWDWSKDTNNRDSSEVRDASDTRKATEKEIINNLSSFWLKKTRS
jgi:hypothetical protein